MKVLFVFSECKFFKFFSISPDFCEKENGTFDHTHVNLLIIANHEGEEFQDFKEGLNKMTELET